VANRFSLRLLRIALLAALLLGIAAGGGVLAPWRGAAGAAPAAAPAAEPLAAPVQEWARSYGGSGSDHANAVAPTADGGYVVAGGTAAAGAGGADAWVLKLDGSGNVAWQKAYGGGGGDSAYAVAPTADGGYVAAGTTASFGAGGADAWALK